MAASRVSSPAAAPAACSPLPVLLSFPDSGGETCILPLEAMQLRCLCCDDQEGLQWICTVKTDDTLSQRVRRERGR